MLAAKRQKCFLKGRQTESLLLFVTKYTFENSLGSCYVAQVEALSDEQPAFLFNEFGLGLVDFKVVEFHAEGMQSFQLVAVISEYLVDGGIFVQVAQRLFVLFFLLTLLLALLESFLCVLLQ